MKRADLTVGQDYLVHDSNDWATGTAYSSPRRVTVIDTRTWDRVGWRYGSQDTVSHDLEDGTTRDLTEAWVVRKGGRHVLVVSVLHPDKALSLVPAAKIRGPWAEAKATHDAAKDRVAAAGQARRERQRRESARAQAAQDRLAAFHPEAQTSHRVTVSLDALEALLKQAGA